MKNFLKKILKSAGYAIYRIKIKNIQHEKQITREDFFDFYFSHINKEEFFFVQIGANDGKTNDPIYKYVTKYNLRGIVIEPQPDVFKLLQKNYQNYQKIRCLNFAIAKKSGFVPFYFVKKSVRNKENFSRLTGLASLNKQTLRKTLKNKIAKGVISKKMTIDDCIQEKIIKAISFVEMSKENNIEKIDFLQIDCEGYDFEILKNIDFEKFSPSIINFESQNLSDDDKEECQKMFEKKGYHWFRSGSDTCMYKI